MNYFNAYLTYTNLIGVLLFITWGSKKFEALPVIQKSLQIFNFFFSNLFLVFFMIYLTHHVIFKKSFSDLLSLFIRPIHDIWGTKSKFLKTRLQWAIAPTISAFLSFFFFSFWICEFMIAYSWASLLFLSILCILFFKRKLFRRLQNLVNKYQRSHHSKNKD
ncbi:hypothetical protein [Lactococcus lactis]|uniref:hypothetical protein n=1 Tax=Lactococcus lactis TaxID=1358 RepID=UPI0018C63A17|nr:hypothetical protein [Lactococcus lactis]MBG1279298.1 hypothetical protein [Lactococcus lactis subsp. lactis]